MDAQTAYNEYHAGLRDFVAGGGQFRDYPDVVKGERGPDFLEAVRVYACEVHGIEHQG